MGPATTAALRRGGPLQRTAVELDHLRRVAAFRRSRDLASKRRVRESDALLEHIEQCRLRGISPLPTGLWIHVVRLVGAVDPQLRDDLGINREADHVSDILFAAQEELLRRHLEERQPRPARIIPLFGERPPAEPLEALDATSG